MQDDPARALGDLVDRARAALEGHGTEVPQGPFRGEVDEGRVVAEADAGGRITALRIDPTMLRRPLEEISALTMAAVNAALDARPQAPDTAALVGQLRAVQQESVDQMARITAAFSTALARAQGGDRG